MIEGAFKHSILEMAASPSGTGLDAVAPWGSSTTNCILISLSVVLALALIRDFFRLWPWLIDSLTRSKGHVSLEHSIQLLKTRNIIAGTLVIPFSLIVDRFELYRIDMLDWIPAGWSTLSIIGMLIVYLLTRALIGELVQKPYRLDNDAFRAARHALYSNFIILTVLMLLSCLIINIADISDSTASVVFYIEIGIIYFISCITSGEILSSRCSAFTTFLYLCALEFVPTGALISAAVLL